LHQSCKRGTKSGKVVINFNDEKIKSIRNQKKKLERPKGNKKKKKKKKTRKTVVAKARGKGKNGKKATRAEDWLALPRSEGPT